MYTWLLIYLQLLRSYSFDLTDQTSNAEGNFASVQLLDLNNDSRLEHAEEVQAVGVQSQISETVPVGSMLNEDENKTSVQHSDESSAALDLSALSVRQKVEARCNTVDLTGFSERNQVNVKDAEEVLLTTIKYEQSTDEKPIACNNEAAAESAVISKADIREDHEVSAFDGFTSANNDVKLQRNESDVAKVNEETELNVNLLSQCQSTVRKSDQSAPLPPHAMTSTRILVKPQTSDKCSSLAEICQQKLVDKDNSDVMTFDESVEQVNENQKAEDCAALVDSSVEIGLEPDYNKTGTCTSSDKTPVINDASLGADSNDKNCQSDVNRRFDQLMNQCIKALELCLARFPQHYKSIYRLAYIHFQSQQFKVCCFLIVLYFESHYISVFGYFSCMNCFSQDYQNEPTAKGSKPFEPAVYLHSLLY